MRKKEKEDKDANLTFQPALHKNTPATRKVPVQPSSVGMQKYMERVQKANKLK